MAEFYNQEQKTTELAELKKLRDVLIEKNMIVESVGWINRKIR